MNLIKCMEGSAAWSERCYTNVICCSFEDPVIEAQPRHEVAVGVGRNLLPGPDNFGLSNLALVSPTTCLAYS